VQFILVGDTGGGSLTVVAWVFKRPDRAGGTVDSRLAASERAESNNFPGFSIRGLLVPAPAERCLKRSEDAV
jgi:hypothetical protein